MELKIQIHILQNPTENRNILQRRIWTKKRAMAVNNLTPFYLNKAVQVYCKLKSDLVLLSLLCLFYTDFLSKNTCFL